MRENIHSILTCTILIANFFVSLGTSVSEFVRSNHLQAHDGKENCEVWKILTVRFPSHGKHSNFRSGISCLCDWVFTVNAFFGDMNIKPKTIYVTKEFLPRFWKFAISIDSYYVLISAGGDITIPKNTDLRYQPYADFGPNSVAWKAMIDSPRIIHWFIENHDEEHPKVSTLPCGIVNHGPGSNDLGITILLNQYRNLTATGPLQKTIQVLSVDRFRSGQGQWKDRGDAYFGCQKSSFCTTAVKSVTFEPNSNRIAETDAPQEDFVKLVLSSKFVVMAHGGGLDPSPKAWEVLVLGSIPILQRSPLQNGYKKLPVAFVDSIVDFLDPQNEAKSKKQMEQWEQELGPYCVFGSALRNETFYRLTTDYWWSQVTTQIKQFDAGAHWRKAL